MRRARRRARRCARPLSSAAMNALRCSASNVGLESWRRACAAATETRGAAFLESRRSARDAVTGADRRARRRARRDVRLRDGHFKPARRRARRRMKQEAPRIRVRARGATRGRDAGSRSLEPSASLRERWRSRASAASRETFGAGVMAPLVVGTVASRMDRSSSTRTQLCVARTQLCPLVSWLRSRRRSMTPTRTGSRGV